MGKLKDKQRAIVGSCCISAVRKSSAKKQVMVYCGSKEGGEAVAGAIQSAYPSYKLYKSENIAGSVVEYVATGALGPVGTYLSYATENWKNFTVRTASESEAEKLVKEIVSCIEEYGGYSEGVGEAGDITMGAGTSGRSGIDKTTLYVVAGALVAIVLAVVLTRKKKKP